MRYALYFAPDTNHTLWSHGNIWLGRNPESGRTLDQPKVPGFGASEIAAHTAAPRRYGLHATIKPPFRLADGRSEARLLEQLENFSSRQTAFPLPSLDVALLDGFIALKARTRSAPLHALADACVAEFDSFRAPPDTAELARRQAERLDAAAASRLRRWGYPHVFEGFEFHMSLTANVPSSVQGQLLPWLESHFAPALAERCEFDQLALYVEPSPGEPFRLQRRFPFGAGVAK
ncbi:MAG: DUF1045 domain-containing protein [Sulfuritalea sp.]|nr:DUF1045 domain-containing protein [Sulfuritalea sp.]